MNFKKKMVCVQRSIYYKMLRKIRHIFVGDLSGYFMTTLLDGSTIWS